jgi:hypothetical protein
VRLRFRRPGLISSSLITVRREQGESTARSGRHRGRAVIPEREGRASRPLPVLLTRRPPATLCFRRAIRVTGFAVLRRPRSSWSRSRSAPTGYRRSDRRTGDRATADVTANDRTSRRGSARSGRRIPNARRYRVRRPGRAYRAAGKRSGAPRLRWFRARLRIVFRVDVADACCSAVLRAAAMHADAGEQAC